MTIWNPNLEQFSGPRYKALAEAIAMDVKTGKLKPGQKLPTHRSLAEQLGVTVGTITRGYQEAEKKELIVARMGSGTFVSGKKRDMSDYLSSLQGESNYIDMSLSVTLSNGQENDLAEVMIELGRDLFGVRELINYEYNAGLISHREIFSQWLVKYGISCDPEQMVICNGGQNAIHTILTAITKPDDRVLSDVMTYPGFTYLAKQHGLKHIGVSMDKDGMIPDQLESLCQKYQPKLFYLIPNLHNPTAVSIPEHRRHQILEIALKNNVLIIEDQVQGLFQNQPASSLHSLAPDSVFFCSSFSKLFAGGLRIGCIASPDRYLNLLKSSLYLGCLFAPPILAEITCRVIKSGRMEAMVRSKKKEIYQRQKLVNRILGHDQVSSQPECPHVWMPIPDSWEVDDFILELQKKGVLVKGTKSFLVGRSPGERGIRICTSSPILREDVEKGLKIIRETRDSMPEVWNSVI